jgi:hypothetical protein
VSTATFTINERAVRAAIFDDLEANMWEATSHLKAVCQEKVSRSQPIAGTGENARGLDPSKEGEPPKTVNQFLWGSIVGRAKVEGDHILGWFGVDRGDADEYAHRLEFGFHGTDSRGRNINQGERPYIRPTVSEERSKVMKILAGG